MSNEYWKFAKYANFAFSFGTTMVLSIFLGYYGGNWLDRKLGTAPIFLVVGILCGTGLAFYSLMKELQALESKKGPAEQDRHRKDE